MQFVVDVLRSKVGAARVLIYGSRAKGTSVPGSDWDIAVMGATDREALQEFLVEMAYDPPVLLPIDILDYDRADPVMKSVVDREGIEVVD